MFPLWISLIYFVLFGLVVTLFLQGLLRLFKHTLSWKKTFVYALLILVSAFLTGFIVYYFNRVFQLTADPLLLPLLVGIVVSFLVLKILLNKEFGTKWLSSFGYWLGLFMASMIFFQLSMAGLKVFVYELYRYPLPTMSPEIKKDQLVLINKFSRDFKRGDIVCFSYPGKPNWKLFARIVGLPGDTLTMKKEQIMIGSEVWDFPYSDFLEKDEVLKKEIPSGQYYLISNQTFNEAWADSRTFGPISKNLILGKPGFIFPE